MNIVLARPPSPGSAQLSLALPFYRMTALESPRFIYSSEIGSSTSQFLGATVAPLKRRRDGPAVSELGGPGTEKRASGGGRGLARMPRRGRNPRWETMFRRRAR